MTETMIVGWDRSQPARSAMNWAVTRGIALDQQVALIRVIDNTISTAEYFVSDSAADAARVALLEDVAEVRRLHPEAKITSELVIGDPSQVLTRLSSPTDVVVVGTHRREGPLARFSWSVGARLSSHCRGPIAIIPEEDGRPRHGVVVGVDWSDASKAAILFAAGEASRSGEELSAIHVWNGSSIARGNHHDQEAVELQRTHEQALELALRPAAERFPRLAINLKVITGRPEDLLAEASRNAALLVVGNHAAAGVIDRVLGSVCSALILGMHGPMVVVRVVAPVD